MTPDPRIFSLVAGAALGEVGDRTEVDSYPTCAVCGRPRAPRTIRSLEIRFDAWSGEDVVEVAWELAVSERLRQALLDAAITGVEFQEAAVSKAEWFEIDPAAYATELPRFWRFLVVGRADGPEIWWKSWTCSACGTVHWDRTDIGDEAETAVISGRVGPPRQVFRDSWNGDDVFRLRDPGPPVVTERFRAVLDQFGGGGAVLHPAEWV